MAKKKYNWFVRVCSFDGLPLVEYKFDSETKAKGFARERRRVVGTLGEVKLVRMTNPTSRHHDEIPF